MTRRLHIGVGAQAAVLLGMLTCAPRPALAEGTLAVTADLPGSTVHIDGKLVGKAPYSGEVATGSHRVVVTSVDGKHRVERVVVVRQGSH